MITKSTTVWSRCCFSLKNYSDTTPCISIYLYDNDLGILRNKLMGFDFAKDITFEEASEIVDLLNKKITGVAVTSLYEKNN